MTPRPGALADRDLALHVGEKEEARGGRRKRHVEEAGRWWRRRRREQEDDKRCSLNPEHQTKIADQYYTTSLFASHEASTNKLKSSLNLRVEWYAQERLSWICPLFS